MLTKMHPLFDYICRQLGNRLKSRGVVVWYDAHGAFAPYIAELRAPSVSGARVAEVMVGEISTHLVEYRGSFFEARALAEPFVSGDSPSAVLLYVPGTERDRKYSVLAELEKAGDCYEPRFKTLAREVLRQRYSDGLIDDLLKPEQVTYEDVARAVSDASEKPSILKGIFQDAQGNDALLAAWLTAEASDAEIEAKEAVSELTKLVRSHLGLEAPEGSSLAKLRAITARYLLVGDLRQRATGPLPEALGAVPAPPTKDDAKAVGKLAVLLRARHPDSYNMLADSVESELRLRALPFAPDAFGSIDTFRFQEHTCLARAGEFIVQGHFDEALAFIAAREHGYWLDRDPLRKAQWEAYRRMADLGRAAASVRASVVALRGEPGAWIDAYVGENGWYLVDQAQRRLETWVANLDDDEELVSNPLGVVRQAYEATCRVMTESFTAALERARWAIPEALHQTQVFSQAVAKRPQPVAYFLVDAMRYEMGVELGNRLPPTAEVSVRHATAMLPSITPIGMAALQPGASSSFDIGEQGGRFGAQIDGTFLPDLTARRKFAASRLPHVVDMSLDDLLGLQSARLAKKIEGASIVIVRSQEIDQIGEAGMALQARQVMDGVIDNLARAVRRLAAAGVAHSVISADHGHFFFPTERDESMKVEAPGGDTVALHRRCWVGRGGATPPGCVRVSAAQLGYPSELELIFPRGCGVFKAGGDLAFHHGGPSLQEIVIPVLTVVLKVGGAARQEATPVVVSGMADAVTNRIFSVTLRLGGLEVPMFPTTSTVRPVLVADGKQVGAVGMVVDAELDGATGCVKLEPSKEATVVFVLKDDTAKSVRIIVQDPATDAELYRSPADIPVRLAL